MRTIGDFNFNQKRVLVRCDFNVPLAPLDSKHLMGLDNKGNILNDFRIRAVLTTIKYLLKNKAKIILMSHLGDPAGIRDKNLSLAPVARRLEELLGKKVKFLTEIVGKSAEEEIEKMKAGEIALLENLRFEQGEEKNNDGFAEKLAALADFYINDAFGVCHRFHASVVGVAKILPSAAGFLLEKEVKVLSDVLEKPKRPLVAVIGGAKIETKIKVIEQFLRKADYLLIGGKIAFEYLKCNDARRRYISKLVLPIDDKNKLDIGPETIRLFSKIIKKAKMIIWNGPLGMFEDKRFEKGTRKIAEAIADSQAFKIAGGGETIEAIEKFGLTEKFDHISTGGGAMLSFLSGEKLPGIEVLK